jgi:hypothetical protein
VEASGQGNVHVEAMLGGLLLLGVSFAAAVDGTGSDARSPQAFMVSCTYKSSAIWRVSNGDPSQPQNFPSRQFSQPYFRSTFFPHFFATFIAYAEKEYYF